MGNNPEVTKAYYKRNREAIKTKERSRRRRRAVMLNELKLGAGCTDCGYDGHPHALDFDHVWGEKVREPSQLRGHSLRTIFDEIAKCEVVCANCHRIRTTNRRSPGGMIVLEPRDD